MTNIVKENVTDSIIASGAIVVNFLENQFLVILTGILIIIRIMNGMKEYRKKT